MTRDAVLCPDCGWTGTQDEMNQHDGVRACPICETDIGVVE